MVDINKIKN